MKTLMILASLLALGACSSAEELATCKGSAFALNTGHWQPALTDLTIPKPGGTE